MSRLFAVSSWAALAFICTLPVQLVFLVTGYIHSELLISMLVLALVAAFSGFVAASLLYPLLAKNYDTTHSAGFVGVLIVLVAYAVFGISYTLLGTWLYPGNFTLHPKAVFLGWIVWSLSPLAVTGIYSLPVGYYVARAQNRTLARQSQPHS